MRLMFFQFLLVEHTSAQKCLKVLNGALTDERCIYMIKLSTLHQASQFTGFNFSLKITSLDG